MIKSGRIGSNGRLNNKHEITTEKDVLEAIIDAVEKTGTIERTAIHEGGVQYLLQVYEGSNMLPSPEEIKRVMLFGKGYYY